MNIKELACSPYLIGVIGKDKEGRILSQMLRRNSLYSNLIISKKRRTTLKERVLSRNQQMIRIDYEDNNLISEDLENEILGLLIKKIRDTNLIVISDYAKGILTPRISSYIINTCKKTGKIVILDPHPQNKELYHYASIITPNVKEAEEMCGIKGREDREIEKIGKTLYSDLKADILITRAERGMSIFYKDESHRLRVRHIPTFARQIRDVTGAGDTVIAALAVGLSNNLNLEEAAFFANHAAARAIEKIGTSTVSLEEVIKDINLHNLKE